LCTCCWTETRVQPTVGLPVQGSSSNPNQNNELEFLQMLVIWTPLATKDERIQLLPSGSRTPKGSKLCYCLSTICRQKLVGLLSSFRFARISFIGGERNVRVSIIYFHSFNDDMMYSPKSHMMVIIWIVK
jgi:hypothetical protein